jgi:ankyrin repeat protein
MWVGDVEFDGRHITGRLLNEPNWLKTHHEGDEVSLTVDQISDWMYVCLGEVYGAYTVQVMRSRMKPQELQAHDAAWGLNFGEPGVVRVIQTPKKKGFLKSVFGSAGEDLSAEHPMAENCAPSIRKQLQADPSIAQAQDDRGWTQLHHFALAGSRLCVEAMLDFGALPLARTHHGMTALDLARSLGWEDVTAALLKAQGKVR